MQVGFAFCSNAEIMGTGVRQSISTRRCVAHDRADEESDAEVVLEETKEHEDTVQTQLHRQSVLCKVIESRSSDGLN